MVPADYFFWFLAGIIAGIAFGSYFATGIVFFVLIGLATSFFSVLAFAKKQQRMLVVALILLGFLLGVLRIHLFAASEDRGGFEISVLASLRDRFERSINRALPEPEASFASGILLGKVRKFPSDLYEALRRTSTLHLVAVSGYNITIVAASVMSFLIFLTVHRKLAWWLAAGGIILFTLFVGAPASAVRAAIMGFLVLIAKRMGRVSDARNALAFAAAAMLLWNPLFLRFDLGFQLSFLATIGILYIAPVILAKLSPQKSLTPLKSSQLKEIASDTLGAQLMVAPWILYKFGTLSLIGIFANILILPLIPLSMFLSFLTGIGGLIAEGVGRFLGLFSFPFLGYSIWIIEAFAKAPFASLTLAKPSLWWVGAMYAGIAILFLKRRQKPIHHA